MKSMTHENGFPRVINHNNMEIYSLSEEHGSVRIKMSSESAKIGDKIKILPNHICTTVNLHDKYYITSNDIVIDIWDISARGKFV